MFTTTSHITDHHLLLHNNSLKHSISAMHAGGRACCVTKHGINFTKSNDTELLNQMIFYTAGQCNPVWGREPQKNTAVKRTSVSADAEGQASVHPAARIAPHLYREHHLRRGRVLRLQRDLQVEDVVDDVLQDLHLADRLVLRDARHQLLQLGVAVVHVAQGAHGLLQARVFIPADGETLLRDTAHGLVAAPHRADGTDGFHDGDGGGGRRR